MPSHTALTLRAMQRLVAKAESEMKKLVAAPDDADAPLDAVAAAPPVAAEESAESGPLLPLPPSVLFAIKRNRRGRCRELRVSASFAANALAPRAREVEEVALPPSNTDAALEEPSA